MLLYNTVAYTRTQGGRLMYKRRRVRTSMHGPQQTCINDHAARVRRCCCKCTAVCFGVLSAYALVSYLLVTCDLSLELLMIGCTANFA